jgi:Flp pilus assembly protein TadG
MLSKKLNTKKSKAQAMVEFAIALPVLLALLYGILEIGRFVFLYSTIVNASRQAVRYGATTGTGNGTGDVNEKRYQDCDQIRKVAKDLAYISSFSDSSITIQNDTGPTDNSPITYCAAGMLTDPSFAPTDNNHRITVKISKLFVPIIPKLVPFAQRTITASSSRTIIVGVAIATPVPAQVASVTTIISDLPDPSNVGEPVTVVVTVTGSAATPTGTVSITGADQNCTITLPATSCTVIFNSGGSKVLSAAYSGDIAYLPSSDSPSDAGLGENHNVRYPTTITFTSISPEPSTSGQAVTVVVTVAGGPTTPTGTFSLSPIAGMTGCTSQILLTNGTGSCSATFTSATTVTKTLTATYTPAVADTTHSSSTGTADHDVIINLDTITRITSISPEPSIIGQAVTVSVKVVGLTTPAGTVNITGADTNCTITLSGGVGSCNVNFASAGSKTLTATYVPSDTHTASSATKAHAVNLQPTVTTITADDPDPSIIGQTISVTVTVTGGTTTPTGTVTITGADTSCVITLVNGSGICNVVFSSSGSKTLAASYSGDSLHAVSSNTAAHTVSVNTSTPVPSCNAITHGPITKTGNTMTMTITNPYGFELTTGTGSVTWNNDKGHQTGGDKSLSLQSIAIGTTNVWTGSSSNVSTIPWTNIAIIPANTTVTITFTFHQTYDNFDGTESIFINLTTPGCESNPITSG